MSGIKKPISRWAFQSIEVTGGRQIIVFVGFHDYLKYYLKAILITYSQTMEN